VALDADFTSFDQVHNLTLAGSSLFCLPEGSLNVFDEGNQQPSGCFMTRSFDR